MASASISNPSSSTFQKAKVFLLALAVIFFNAAGNLALAWGMKRSSAVELSSPLSFLPPMLNPAVAAGILLLILWLLTRMTLLSWADLSFVLPITSLGYVLAAVLGRVFLNEQVTAARWAGTVLIFAGSLLVGSTRQFTTPRENNSQ